MKQETSATVAKVQVDNRYSPLPSLTDFNLAMLFPTNILITTAFFFFNMSFLGFNKAAVTAILALFGLQSIVWFVMFLLWPVFKNLTGYIKIVQLARKAAESCVRSWRNLLF